MIGSLTPQRYCSPEPQPMPAFEDIPEGQVYDPDFLFSLIESDTFAAPKPPASGAWCYLAHTHTHTLAYTHIKRYLTHIQY